MAAVIVVSLAVSVELARPTLPAALAAPSAVTDVGPNVVTPAGSLKYGGRIESVAINPVNPQIVFGASELGGLWRSNDAGENWAPVPSFPLTRMYDVEFAESDANLVIATADNDGSSPNRGGIWRSTDGGATWTRPNPGPPAGCNSPTAGAHFVDIAPGTPGSLTVVAGTDNGISVSTDSGATWVQRTPGALCRYWDAKARVVPTPTSHVQIDACGDSGFVRSNDGGTTFTAETAIANAGAWCRVATAPNDANTVFISSPKTGTTAPACSSLLVMSTNANATPPTFTDLNACPSGARNGRARFVVTHPDNANPTTQFQVYFGDNTRTEVQTCTYGPTACAGGPWGMYDGSHPHNGTDPTDVAFDPTIPNGCPALVAGDGGVAKPSDCSTSPGSFDMKNTGLKALQALNIAGTVYPNPGGHTDVYFGTQDNGLFASTDDAGTWNRTDYDIYGLMADHRRDPAAVPASRVVWRFCCFAAAPNSHLDQANEDLSGRGGFSLPPGNNPGDNYMATQFGHDRYAFVTPDAAPPGPPAPNWQMQVTTNNGGGWTQMGPNAPAPPGGSAGNDALQASGQVASPTFYMLLAQGGTNHLYRLAGPLSSSAVWTDVTGNLANPNDFAVHPTNPLLLYAWDAGTNQVMKSTNGGASWVPDTNLTTLATRGGQYPVALDGSRITAFGFDGNSNTVMAGANTSGVFASTDGGANWFSVPGAENLPRIAGFFFDERTNSVYIASGGRGVWRLGLPSADLKITKTASPEPVKAGNQLTYTITVTNDSASPATAGTVGVTDTLPSQVTYLTSSNANCVEAPPGTLRCPVPDLDPGNSYTFTVTVLVHSDAVVGSGGATTIYNTATVGSIGTSENSPADNTATVASTVVDSADLQVTKVCTPDTTVPAGSTLSCEVYVDNHGPSDARNVVADDVMQSSGTFTVSAAAVTPGPGTCSQSAVSGGGKKLTCTLGTVPAASATQSGRVTVSYQVDANDAMDIDNVASVRSDTPDPSSPNNQDQVNLRFTASADLALTKNGDPSVTAGMSTTWTLSVHNFGPSKATNVVIRDFVPAGVSSQTVAMPGASCVVGVPGDASRPTVCTLGQLASGATSSTMTITAVVDPSTTGVLHNDGRVTSAAFDPNSSNDLAHTDTAVVVQNVITVVKTATPTNATAGTPLSYKIVVTNTGPSTATGVTLTDPLPNDLIFSSASSAGTCGFETNLNRVTCQLPTLLPGQSTNVFIYTTVQSSTLPSTLSNTASVSSASNGPFTGSTDTQVQTRADLVIVLSSDKAVYKPSSVIHYTATVTNNGPSDAQNVVVTQTLPPPKSAIYDSNNRGCPAPVSTTFTCALGTIPAGGTSSYVMNALIRGNKGTISSTASVSSGTTDPVASNNSSTRVVTVK